MTARAQDIRDMDDIDVLEDALEYDGELESVREVSWQAPEHHHFENGADWFWALGILTLAASVAMIVFGNVLFGIVILLAGAVVALIASRPPQMIAFAVSLRGIRAGNDFYPYGTLKCFSIDEDHPHGPHLLVMSKNVLAPMLIVPLPEETIDEIGYMIGRRLPEEHLEEPLAHRLLEFLGF